MYIRKSMNKKKLKKERARKRELIESTLKQRRRERREWDFLNVLPLELWAHIFLQIDDYTSFFNLARTCKLLYHLSRNTPSIAKMFMTRYTFESIPFEDKPYLDTFHCTIDGKYHGPLSRTFCYTQSEIIHYDRGILHGWKINFKTGEPYKARRFENGVGKEVRFRLPHDIKIHNESTVVEGPVTKLQHEYMCGDPYYTLDPFAGNSYVAVRTTFDNTEEFIARVTTMLTTPFIRIGWNFDFNHVDVFMHRRLLMTFDILKIMGYNQLYVYSFYTSQLVRRIYHFNDCTMIFRYRKNGQLCWFSCLSPDGVARDISYRIFRDYSLATNWLVWGKMGKLHNIHQNDRVFTNRIVVPQLEQLHKIARLDHHISYLQAGHLDKVLRILKRI